MLLPLLVLLACSSDDGACATAGWVDADGDGWGDAAAGCDAEGAVDQGGDCDDEDGSVHPGAVEVCDGVDHDCDGTAGSAADAPTWYADKDGDGFGDPGAATAGCVAPAGTVADATDCDDTDYTIYPEAGERCNELDDDCDGSVDEDAGTEWWPDGDGDGHAGLGGTPFFACDTPDGARASADDCDDGDATVHPGADDACGDGVDADCDGVSAACRYEGEIAARDADMIWEGPGDFGFGAQEALVQDLDGDGFDDVVTSTPGSGGDGGGVGASWPGMAWILYGGAGLGGFASAAGAPGFSLDECLEDIVSAGDVDGDGLGDLLAAGSCDDAGGSGQGEAWLIYGSTTRLASGNPDLSTLSPVVFTGSREWGYAGHSMASGDFDGDGLSDPVIAQPGTLSPAVSVLFGQNGRWTTTERLSAAPTIVGPNWSGFGLGSVISSDGSGIAAMDLDGDGLDELAVGASTWPGTAGWATASGAVYVFADLGSGFDAMDADADATARILGTPDADAYTWFGGAVADAGDVDGDGRHDLVVGDIEEDRGGTFAGAVRVFYGRAGGFHGDSSAATADVDIVGAAGTMAGTTVEGVGDLDRDGFDDLAFSGGAVVLFYGSPYLAGTWLATDADARIVGDGTDAFGRSISGGGDLNGDGTPDFVAGTAYAGSGGELYAFLGGGS